MFKDIAMKVIKSFLFFLLLQYSGPAILAQIIVTDPAFPTESGEVTITYDATEGNGELAGFTGDVYLYTGAITSESNGEWKNVQPSGGWTNYPENLKAISLGNDKWEFTYGPSVREFFNITDFNETILEIAVLFRGTVDGSGNPDAVGRASGGGDIFVPLSTRDVNAQFISPFEDFEIIEKGNTFELVGIGSVSEGTLSLKLLKEGIEVASTSDDTLRYTFDPAVGENDANFSLIADNGQNIADTASTFITIRDNVGETTARPGGLEDGITLSSNSISLSLFAPNKEYVYVIGDFNDWTPTSEYLMSKETAGADSAWFWIENISLNSREEYTFQYLVDGEIRIADPYSEQVLDSFNDQYIPEATYPNLKPYPQGQTAGLVSLVRPGVPEFTWEATNYQRPEKTELVVYQLLIRDFIEAQNYQTLTDTLDYLENLGVNAIELLPISEYDGNLSWGYNPSFHLALDKYYGTPEAFKRFVDEAHKRDMAVILDVVMNHATDASSLYRLYDYGENPYFNPTPTHAYNVFNDFDHSYSGTRYYTKRMIEYWINEYNIDGFRWDLTKGFTQNCTENDESCTGRYQQDRVDVLKEYADYQWAADPDFYVIFEHLGGEQEEAEWANYRLNEGNGIMLWGNMNGPYNEATMGFTSGNNSDLTRVLSESRSSFQGRRLIGYMESHDEQRLMYKNLLYGAQSGDYNIKELSTALDRQKIAGAFFFTLPGPKMFWQFGELGYDVDINFNGRTGEKPIRWEYFEDSNRLKLYKTWSALLTLRHSSPAFTQPENATYNLVNAVKYITLEHQDTDVVIAGNFGIEETNITLDYTQDGTWYNYFDASTVDVTNLQRDLTLRPGEFRIYTTKEFAAPEEGIVVSNETPAGDDVPQTFRLGQNYPNPFNPTTSFAFDVARASDVKLEVFDMLGRKVRELVNERKVAGIYTISLEAGELSSGMYIYRLQAGDVVLSKKMTLIK
ncbi:MAG: alpha-amylase family glycosyl hydrolase [Gracilimonas sp.]|uniref:alpha-amylase family glycosyl hydrolase n=1 Tax=Gracilimonas sp. TaxID=1974203 RepID=UPI0037518E43|nr:alpha-amylase family glycosyl hydrolase [Gracilimonas sp.]